ncbi:MAG: EamA family transporter [bacterium]
MPASAFALLSAVLFAGNAVTVRVALAGTTASTLVLVSLLTNFLVLWAAAAADGELRAALHPAALIFLGAGVLAPALARAALYTSIGMIGVARATVAANTTPIFTAVGAALVLGERVSWPLALGTVVVVLGVALTSSPAGAVTEGPAGSVTEGRISRAGLLLALSTAVLAAVSFLLRKIGLAAIPHPALGAALTVTGALAGLLPLALLRGRRESVRVERRAVAPMVAAALLSSGGFLAYFLALGLGDVSRVTPLSNTTPLFAVLLLQAGFRHVEGVSRRTFAGVALAVLGVVLVLLG